MFNQDVLLKFIQTQAQKNQPVGPKSQPQMAKGGDAFSEKVRKLMQEGYPQKQAVAIAYSYKDRGKLQVGGSSYFSSHKKEGLPHGPNEVDSYTQGVITTSRGQWDYPGQVTRIPSNRITMQGVNYPVLGVSDTGHTQMMHPEGEYKFDGNSVTEYPMAQEGLEMRVNHYLGEPMKKAQELSKGQKWFNPETKKWEQDDDIDNFRHPLAGRFTAEAIANKFPNAMRYTGIPQAAGFLGANALGIAHEIANPNTNKDYSLWDTIREGGEDAFNNFVGSGVGTLPLSADQKTRMLKYLSDNNMLPDGYGKGNMYVKKEGGHTWLNQYPNIHPKLQDGGGWLDSYKKAGTVREQMEQLPSKDLEQMPVNTTEEPIRRAQEPIVTSHSEPTFAGAFDRARMEGASEFTWNGKTYSADLASERKAPEVSGTVNTPKTLPNKQSSNNLPTAEIVAQRGTPNWNMDAVTRMAFGQKLDPQYINTPTRQVQQPQQVAQQQRQVGPTVESLPPQQYDMSPALRVSNNHSQKSPIVQKSIEQMTNESFGVKSPGKNYFGHVENTETGPVGITSENSSTIGVTGAGGFTGAKFHNAETEKLSTGPSSFIPVSSIITPVSKTQPVVDNTGKELVKTLQGHYIYSDDDLKAKSVVQNRAEQCSIDSKGNCLAGTNMWINRYVAPGLDVLNTDQINDKYNIQSGNENSGYGPTADSWDIQGLLQKNGAKQLYAAKNVSDWRKLSDQKKKEIYSQMTIGTLIGAGGESGLPDRDEYRAANKKQGLIANRHSYRVVGYSDDKDHTPIVAEFGHGQSQIRKITDTPLFNGDKENPDKFNITNITIPKEYSHLTYDYVKGKDQSNSKANYYDKNDKLIINKANLRSSDNSVLSRVKGEETPFDSKEQSFIDGINDNIKTIMQVTGATQADVLNAGKLAFGIFQNETRGGRSKVAEAKQSIASLRESIGGEDASKGVTRMKYSQLVGKDKKSKIAKMFSDFGITEEDFDLKDENVPKQALATVLSILSHSGNIEGVNKWAVLAKQHQKPYLNNKDVEYLKKGESDYSNNALKNASRIYSKSTGQGIPDAIDELAKRKETNKYNNMFIPTGITGPAGYTGASIAQKKNGGTWLDNY